MAVSGWTGRSRKSVYRSVLIAAGFAALTAPALASNVGPIQTPAIATYEQALTDYEAGNMSAALLFAKAAGGDGG